MTNESINLHNQIKLSQINLHDKYHHISTQAPMVTKVSWSLVFDS